MSTSFAFPLKVEYNAGGKLLPGEVTYFILLHSIANH